MPPDMVLTRPKYTMLLLLKADCSDPEMKVAAIGNFATFAFTSLSSTSQIAPLLNHQKCMQLSVLL